MKGLLRVLFYFVLCGGAIEGISLCKSMSLCWWTCPQASVLHTIAHTLLLYHTHALAYKYSHPCSLCLLQPYAHADVCVTVSVWHSHTHHVWDWRDRRGVCVSVTAWMCVKAIRACLKLRLISPYSISLYMGATYTPQYCEYMQICDTIRT